MLRRVFLIILALVTALSLASCGDKEEANQSSEEVETVVWPDVGYTTYMLNFVDNGNGTGTAYISIPEGICNGRVVLKTSDKLSYVENSLRCELNCMVVKDDALYAENGLDLLFADAEPLPKNSNVFIADFEVNGSDPVTADDFILTHWEIGDGVVMLATIDDGDIIKQID